MILLLFLIASLATAQQPSDAIGAKRTAEVVQTITEKQRERPFWFVLNSVYLDSIPFAYRVSTSGTGSDSDVCRLLGGMSNSVCVTTRGKEGDAASPTEHAPAPEPMTFWCLAARNGGFGCASKLTNLKDVERPRPGQKFDRAERFWGEFRKAFDFESTERQSREGRPTIVLSFVPRPGYLPPRNDDSAIFPFIRGRIWIDETELEIARFKYEFFKDSSVMVFGQILKGTRYAMDLQKQLDGYWLPTHSETELHLDVLNVTSHETSSMQFSDYIK